jgi:acyl-coenzyme A thioesterase PaaI-like protein
MESLTGKDLSERAALVLAVPLAHALGIRLLDEADPAAGAWFQVTDLALNGAGGAHASAVTTALELAGYLALATHLTSEEHAVTHMVATTMAAAAREGDRVEVRGTLDRRTKRLAFVSVVATVAGETVARATLTKSNVPWG